VKRYLFDFLEDVTNQLKSSSSVLLFLDYDGTVVPIRKEPSLALLSTERKSVIRTLSRIPWLFAGIISGRPLKEVRKLVGDEKLFYAGNHGFEILFKEKVWIHPELMSVGYSLIKVSSELKSATQGIKGILIEDKQATVSVHYRKVTSQSPGSILKTVLKVVEPYPDLFEVTRGKKVYEIRPCIDWDKGKAVVKISQFFDFKPEPLKIYIGDDVTDEDAFGVLGKDDISIRVGYKKGSKAQYFCRGSTDVLQFLRHVITIEKL
jgi:trehalose 6-phosphate phosphatase